MSLLAGFAVGACIGIWLDIALERWGSAFAESYIGRGLAPVLEYLAGSIVLAWEFIRFDVPNWIRDQAASLRGQG